MYCICDLAHKYDALGEALAIISGVANETQAQQIIANYPHSAAGIPVIWPQQPETFVYHNRAIWPFVSAYILKAAKAANNDTVVNHNIDSIIRGSALNLSNMENFEFLTQNNHETDLNSQRQLWSVAAYIAMVQDVIFGQQADAQGLQFKPYITAYLRNSMFATQSSIELNNIDYQGKQIDLKIQMPLPSTESQGVYEISSTTLNGAEVAGVISPAQLGAKNAVVITLGALKTTQTQMTLLDDPNDHQALFAPKEPTLAYPSIEAGKVKLAIGNNGETGTVFNIFRNGEKVAENLAGNSTSWLDANSSDYATRTYCYAVEQVFTSSNNASHHSAPQCYWADNTVTEFTPSSGLSSLDGASTEDKHNKLNFGNWGAENQKLQAQFTAQASGEHYLQTTYGNAFNTINTGITASVKTITVEGSDGSSQTGVVYMPHQQAWSDWADSNLVPFELSKDVSYTVTISDFFNMSYLKHFESYKSEGGSEPKNRANIAALKVLRM